jgi:alkylhydroperoxidase family enzyme
MNRTLEIPAEKLTGEQKTVFDQLVAGRGRILGPYKIWIHSPTVASGMEHIGTFLNKRSSLSTREVEIGILVIAQHWDGEYVKQAHIKAGKAAGLTQEQIDDILAGRDPKLADARGRLRTSPRFPTPNSPRSRRRSAAKASPKFWCCSATTPRLRSA